MAGWRARVAGWLGVKSDDPTVREAALRGGLPVARSGATVTAESALYVSTVLACARVYMNGTAQVPWRLMLEAGGEELKKIDPAKEVSKMVARLSGTSTASPASSELTPDLSPSAN